MCDKLLKMVENLRNPQRSEAARRQAQRGMTLIEIMVVIVIIGVLGAALAYNVFGYLKESKVDAAKIQLRTVYDAVHLYEARHDSVESLAALTEGKTAPLKAEQLKDPWQKELTMSGEGDDLQICSSGPDKKSGTEDDLCEPSSKK